MAKRNSNNETKEIARVLKLRYAKGEITKKEYDRLRKDLAVKYTTKNEKLVKQEVRKIEKETGIETKEAKVKKETAILGHFKPKFFIILAILIVLVVGFVVYFVYKSANQTSCTSNNQCQNGSYCSSYEVCIKNVCGDGVCLVPENQSNCPIDCGCPSGQVLNEYLNRCQTAVTLSPSTINAIVGNWLTYNAINGTITGISDTYYENQTVKSVTVNCAPPNSKYPCQLVFYINYQAQIINVTSTT